YRNHAADPAPDTRLLRAGFIAIPKHAPNTGAAMPSDDPQLLVSTDWLAARLTAPDLRIVDASWHLPGADRDARAEYAAGHIPGARFFDIDAIADTRSGLPHMAPPPEVFAS